MAAGGPSADARLTPVTPHVDDPEYLAEHLRAALATDTRVLQPGLEVRVDPEAVVVRGCVPTEGVKASVAAVVRENLAGRSLVNEVEVTPNAEPDHVEDMG